MRFNNKCVPIWNGYNRAKAEALHLTIQLYLIMKLHLPKFLLMALLAVQALPFSNAAEAYISAGTYHYESNQLVLTSDITMSAEHGISWAPTADSAELTGNGTISCEDGSWYFYVGYHEQETKGTYVVGEDITLKNADVFIDATEDSKLEINGTLDACKIDANKGIIDLTHTTVRGNTDYEIEHGGTIVKANVEVKPNNYLLTNSGDSSDTTDCANLEGNLVMNGVAPSFTTEQVFDYYPDGCVNPSLRPYGLLVYWTAEDEDSFTPLNVKGSVTILSETGVLFANEGAWEHRTEGDTTITTWSSDYRTPTNDEAVLICTGVDAGSLALLKPFAWREDTWSEYGSGDDATDGGNEYVKPLADREFYAKAGNDGKVYIYLGEKLDYVVLNDWTSGADIRDKHIVVNGNCSFSADSCPRWIGTGDGTNYEMTGSGAISADEAWYLQISTETEAPVAFSIARDITLENALVDFEANSASSLQINGTLKDSNVHVWSGKVDVSNTTMSGSNFFQISRGATLAGSNFEVKENVALRNFDGYPVSDSAAYATLEGNLVMNGSLPGIEAETQTEYDHGGWAPALHSSGYVQFGMDYDEFAPLNVTGSITINSATAVVFSASEVYTAPEAEDSVFICSSVTQSSLNLLKPYAVRRMHEEMVDYTKPLEEREFYARAGDDGKVHIYLGEAQPGSGGDDIVAPPVPEVPIETITINSSKPGSGDSYYGSGYEWQNCNLKLEGAWAPEVSEYYPDGDEAYPISWSGDGNYTMSGTGELGNNSVWTEIFVRGKGTFTIGSDINIVNSEICLGLYEHDSKPTLEMNGTLTNSEVYVAQGIIDLTHTKFSGVNAVGLERDCTLRASSFTVNQNTVLTVYNSAGASSLDGNLIINSNTANYPVNGGEVQFRWENIPYVGTVTFDAGSSAGYGRLDITGNLIVKSQSIVLLQNEVADYDAATGGYASEYVIPENNHVFFTCAGVTKDTLNLLAPVASKYISTEEYDEETGELLSGEDTYYFKHLADRKFYAQVGADGRVEICLGSTSDVSDPSIPNAPSDGGTTKPEEPVKPVIPPSSIVVGSGSTVELGKDEATTPSISKPVYIQGGSADASGLDEALLNNKVIQGTSGSLVTGADQSMDITGSGSLGYSVIGTDTQTPGADLKFQITGELSLEGKKYDTAKADISGGVLTIDPGTRLGMGTEKTEVKVESGASLTNFGTVAADVELAGKGTMLNQGKVEGNILLQSGSTLVNNSTVSGDITVEAKALLSGSGSAGNLWMKSGSALNVGNSPGWQKYKSVTIERGSQLTFTVDGTTPATATDYGTGTHSVLQADTLTIGDGTDTVKVTVNVTLGIVTAGTELIDVALMEVGTTNATEDDFTITLNDNDLLEEGAEVSWDAASQSLTLTGSVSKTALATLTDSNAASVANTMWASANAVQEFARTAEHQFLVGMPGQTTFWGAALGSFMDISGDAGFTSNMGGYAVGLQHAFTESFRAGFAFGQSFGSFTAEDDLLKADQTALMPALTAQYVTPLSKVSSLSISGHIAYGTVENEADTYQAGTAGKAEWDDKVLNIGLRATWNRQLTDNTTVSLFTGLTYQSVDQDSFTEKFDGGERDYRSGSLSSLSLPIGATWRGIYQMEGTNVFVPELTVAYIGDIARDNPEVKTSVMGITREGKGTNIGRSALMLNAGANWMFDSTWSVGAFYTLETRSHQLNQSVNAALRCCF